MRILLAGKYPPIQGGVSRMVWSNCQDLVDNGLQVDVVTNAFDFSDNIKRSGR